MQASIEMCVSIRQAAMYDETMLLYKNVISMLYGKFFNKAKKSELFSTSILLQSWIIFGQK